MYFWFSFIPRAKLENSKTIRWFYLIYKNLSDIINLFLNHLFLSLIILISLFRISFLNWDKEVHLYIPVNEFKGFKILDESNFASEGTWEKRVGFWIQIEFIIFSTSFFQNCKSDPEFAPIIQITIFFLVTAEIT